MTDTIPINLTVNGDARDGVAEARKTLADFLREDLGLTGTHLGCEHGVCGACTVLLDGEPVRSCLMLAVQARGRVDHHDRGARSDGRHEPAAGGAARRATRSSAASARPAS